MNFMSRFLKPQDDDESDDALGEDEGLLMSTNPQRVQSADEEPDIDVNETSAPSTIGEQRDAAADSGGGEGEPALPVEEPSTQAAEAPQPGTKSVPVAPEGGADDPLALFRTVQAESSQSELTKGLEIASAQELLSELEEVRRLLGGGSTDTAPDG